MVENKKLTRKEKSEINKKKHAENMKKAKKAAREEKEAITIAETNDKYVNVLRYIESGLNIVQACARSKISVMKFYEKRDEDKEFAKSLTRAREISDEREFEEMHELVNAEPRQIYDAQQNKIYDKSELEWRRLRLDVKKWRLAIKNAKRYGNAAADKVENTQINFYATASDQINENVQKLIDITPKKTKKIEDII